MSAIEIKNNVLFNLEDTDNQFIKKIQQHRIFFRRTIECLTEEDSNFQPSEQMLSVAGQVLHVIMAIEYFLSGMFGPYKGFGPLSRRDKGFVDMEWMEVADHKFLGLLLDANSWPAAVEASTSLTKALELFDQTMETAAKMFGSKSTEQIQTAQLPENPIFPPEFTCADILEMMNDHIAHHRGCLVVYAHLLRREPKIPYFEMSETVLNSQRIQSLRLCS